MPIGSISDVKAYLRIADNADDTLITAALDTATLWVQQTTGRTFANATDLTERQVLGRNGLVRVSNPPINTVASVKVGTLVAADAELETLTTDAWRIHNATRGLIYVYTSFLQPPGDDIYNPRLIVASTAEVVVIAYNGGGQADARVKQASVMYAAWLFQTPEFVAGALESGSAMGRSATFLRGAPPEAYDLLRPYIARRRVRAI